ncbi:MAG: SDR family oxidoreductase, partial [Methylocystis sp.]|nr:SDR family oxidoreductase [Methylocystis sp.]
MSRALIVGGTGYLGSLIGATLLTKTQDVVVLAARPGHAREDIVARLRMEMSASGDPEGHALERLRIVRLPDPGDRRGFVDLFRENRIDDVINCAGSVHYFDVALLQSSNVDLVNDLLAAAKETPVRRFIHVSTAFASGYINGVAREALFDEPNADPTEYTRYKRRAEWLIAESGLPYLILRPSIVIGDSRDGHYFGPPYGVYQFWHSTAKILMDRYRPVLHAIASEHKLPLVHQDAFAATFLMARETISENAIINVVSSPDAIVSVEDLWRLW